MSTLIDVFGSVHAAFEYSNQHGISVETELPKAGPVEVLADYRPYGGVMIVGFESGKFWDEYGEPKLSPMKWAYLPKKK